MVVNLQAISMMAEVLNARLERGTPAPTDFQVHISKLNRLAREAVASCLKVAAWIEPGEDEGVALAQGVDECLGLLASNFNFRGFAVSREVSEGDFQVWHIALRNLLVASLVALTDACSGPCEVRVKAGARNGFADITVRVTPRTDGAEGLSFEPSYRRAGLVGRAGACRCRAGGTGARPARDHDAHAARRCDRAAADRARLSRAAARRLHLLLVDERLEFVDG